MKNIEVLNALAACDELAGTKLKFKAAMTIRKLFRELSSIAEDIEAERQKLLNEYGQKDSDGQFVPDGDGIAFDDRNGFVSAYDELLRTEVKVEGTITATMLRGTEVEPRLLIMLGDLLEE